MTVAKRTCPALMRDGVFRPKVSSYNAPGMAGSTVSSMDQGYRENYRNAVVLVTGGAGAIGTNLCTELADCGAGTVIVLDDLSAGYRWNVPDRPNVLFVPGSVTDDVVLRRVFAESPTHVFHLAAFFANQNSVDYPQRDLHVNGLGTLKILEYARLCGVQRLIYASSGSSVYGSKAPLPLTEDFMSMPLSTPYQITKMMGEMYCNLFHDHYNLPVVKARFFNSYGPGEVPGQYRNVIPNFIYWALQGEPLTITGTGDETRDFTYIDDLIDGLLRAGQFEEAIGTEFNLAGGHETKISDLASMINSETGNTAGIKFAKRRKWDTRSRRLASIERAKTLIGYQPCKDFREGLAETVQWFRDKWEDIQLSASFAPGMSSAVRNR